VGRVVSELVVAADDEELALLAAEVLARAIDDAARSRGVARVALSGGSTPGPAYRALAGLDLPWDRTEWFQVDERAGPPDGDRSNFAAADRALRFAERGVPAERVHRMEADRADLAAAAAAYERRIRASFGAARAVALDAMVLGLGDDGHTASLFPRTGDVAIDDRLVAATSPPGLEPRLTLTAPVLREARLAVVLARGGSKKEPVARARADGDADEVPGRVLLASRGRVVWIVDRAVEGG
jgi:6-phosphogluconolactonase